MKRHLNLMSNRSRVQTCARKRLRQWIVVLTVLGFLLVPTWFAIWLPVHQQGEQVAALEARYEPFRQMNKASKEFKKRIELVQAQEKISLALAKIDTPVVTLLGIVGKTVAESQRQVYLEKIEFQQSALLLSKQESETTRSISVAGRGISKKSVIRLRKNLKAALPFADVKLRTSKPEFINQQQIEKFLLQSSF